MDVCTCSVVCLPCSDGLREHLKNAPKRIMAQAQAVESSDSSSDSDSDSDSASDSG